MSSRRPAGGRRVRRRLHPIGWVAPVGGTVVAMAAWAAVAHSSGSGWVQALGVMVGAVLVAGMAVPAVSAARATAACVTCPSDAEAGEPVDVVIEANGPFRLRPKSPAGQPSRAAGGPSGARRVALSIRPHRRGVLDRIVVEVATSAPFGILWWGRDLVVLLPRPLHVAPRRGEQWPVATAPLLRDEGSSSPVPAGLGDPRGVRPYASGDPRRSVHWPATAHVGALMVRERERTVEDPVVIDVVLPTDEAAADTECERAMGNGCTWLERGRAVILRTDEERGPVSGSVRDRVELGRRLARAQPLTVDRESG